MSIDPHIAAQFIKRLADTIIWGRDNGVPMDVMEGGFNHAWLHVFLLNMKDTPPLPAKAGDVTP